jgi:hypothetical protein
MIYRLERKLATLYIVCLPGSRHFLQPAIPPATLARSLVFASVSGRRKTNLNIFCNPITSAYTKVCNLQLSISSINYFVNYNY